MFSGSCMQTPRFHWGLWMRLTVSYRNSKVCGGFFRIRLPQSVVYRLTDGFAHYAGLLLRMRCGDHGIFCRRTAFIDAGGFPNVPLMEDVEFFRRLRRCGQVIHSNKRIGASPRRYEAVGPLRLTFAYGFIATLYRLRRPFVHACPRLPTHLLAAEQAIAQVDRSQSNRRRLLRARDYAA